MQSLFLQVISDPNGFILVPAVVVILLVVIAAFLGYAVTQNRRRTG